MDTFFELILDTLLESFFRVGLAPFWHPKMRPFWRSFSGMGEKARIELRLERQLDSRGLEGPFFDVFVDEIFDALPRSTFY